MLRLINFPSSNHYPGKHDECSEDLTSNFLRSEFAKARSLTGVSVCSTESFSTDYTDQSETSIGNEEEPLFGEKILEDVEEDFFDCVSQASGYESGEDTEIEDEVAIYLDGKCIYSDGRPAHVPPGNCISKVSADYIEFCQGDHARAQRMWKATLKWRQENGIWKILTKSNIPFRHAKRYYPTCYHGFSKAGVVVEYSFPGRMDASALLPNRAVIEDLMDAHYFMQEYVSNCLYTCDETWQQLGVSPLRQRAQTISSSGVVIVIDAKGAGPHLLTSKVLAFLKRMISSSSAHYPTLAKLCLIINAPFWVAGVFATLKPLLPDNIPVEIVSERDSFDALREYINDDQIPEQYGGSSCYKLHEHPFELRLHQFVHGTMPDGWSKGIDIPDDQWEEPDAGTMSSSETYLPSRETSDSNCFKLPFRVGLRYSEPQIESDNETDRFVLTPRQKRLDVIGLIQSFARCMAHGFVDCTDRASD